MARTTEKPKKGTKSQRSRSTKRSSEYTRTSRKPKGGADSPKQVIHQQAANELFSRSLRPKTKIQLQEAIVEGISMWPALRPGYRVQYKSVDPEHLCAGDLLVLESKGRRGERHWRVHRLLGRAGPFFVESGDNTYSAALVRAEDILGRVERVRDWNGRDVRIADAADSAARRFRFWLSCAQTFMFLHECKDRLVGRRKSLWLWRLSQAYRASLSAAGLQVPIIFPDR